MTISESKKALRKEILAKRRNLSEAYRKQAAKEIYEKLRMLAVYKEATVLCLYVPIQNEVDLFQYIPEFRADGKKIYLPRVNGNTMDFYAYNIVARLLHSYEIALRNCIANFLLQQISLIECLCYNHLFHSLILLIIGNIPLLLYQSEDSVPSILKFVIVLIV